MSDSVRVRVIFDIRDARGLTTHDKTFLFTVESRGFMRRAAAKAADDMAMSLATYYRVRTTLLGKGLIDATRSLHGVTTYRVNAEMVSALVERGDSQPDKTPSQPDETPSVAPSRGVSLCDNQKEIFKKTKKETFEEELEEDQQKKTEFEVVPDLKELNLALDKHRGHLTLMIRHGRVDEELAGQILAALALDVIEELRSGYFLYDGAEGTYPWLIDNVQENYPRFIDNLISAKRNNPGNPIFLAEENTDGEVRPRLSLVGLAVDQPASALTVLDEVTA